MNISPLEEAQHEIVVVPNDLHTVLLNLISQKSGCCNNSTSLPGGTKQEKEVSSFLYKHNFSEIAALKGRGNSDLSKYEHMLKVGQFIYNPRGSQKAPDFLIRDKDGLFYVLECKSCKNGRIQNIQWNSGIPENSFIYLIDTGKERHLSMGYDIITEEERKNLIELGNDLALIASTRKHTLGNWNFYMRPMHTIKHKLPKTAKERTKTVLNAIKEKNIKLWS